MALQLERVLISDAVDASCRRILEGSGIGVDYKPGLPKDELLSIVKNYDGLVVRSGTKVTAEVIKAGARLKLIGRAGTGVDNIDLNAATAQGIIVMNTPGGNTISAAEHTCAMICALARNIPQGYASMMAGKWDRKKYMGVELDGKTLGIIGLGRIGREVATRMQAFGMKTVGYDPLVPAEEASQFGVEFLEMDQIWPIADFITVHTPLIPATKGLIGDKVFATCKRGMRVVNVARGGIIDEEALVRALQSGQCGGAGLDVFTTEPPTDKSLLEHEKVVTTPHLGASTTEAQLKVAQEIAQQFVDAVQGMGLNGVVNAPYLANAMSPSTSPWVQLGRRLGRLLAAVLEQRVTKVSVTIRGDAIKSHKEFLLPATLVGVLGGGANLVNATSKAKQMGMATESLAEGGRSDNVRVEVSGGGKTMSVCGTVVGTAPVLVQLNDQDTGLFELGGKMMVAKDATLVPTVQSLTGVLQASQVGSMVLVKAASLPAPSPGRISLSYD